MIVYQVTLSFFKSEAFHLICILWILEEGLACPPANQLPLHLPSFLFLVHTALLEDLLSTTGVRLEFFVSSEELATDEVEDETGDWRTIISGFSFGPGLSQT